MKVFVPGDGAMKCFSYETPVMTQSGSKLIGDLSGSAHKLLTQGGAWVNAPVSSSGAQKLMKVTLSRSGVMKVIHATPDHRWILSPLQRRFTLRKFTRDLKPKDRLAQIFPTRANVFELDAQGVARGFVFGDGAVSSPNRACANFCGDKDMHLLPIFVGRFGLPARKYRAHTRVNGLPAEWKTQWPDLQKETCEILYGWLSGYFAADGDVDKTGRPTLSSANRANLDFTRELCTRLGIGTFGIRQYDRRGFGKRISAIYLLGLMRKDLDANFFQIPEHRRRFQNCVGRVAERRAWTVVSVEETARLEEVFCAVVDSTHSFALEDNILVQSCWDER